MSRTACLRLLLLLAIHILLMLGAKYALGNSLTFQHLQEMLDSAGVFGSLLFLGAAMVGTLLHIPAFVILVMCFLLYNGLAGALMGIATTIVIFTAHFFFARLIGGNITEHVKHPFLVKKLDSLNERPLKSIVTLRLAFFMNPFLSFALAMSAVRYRDFIIGSLIGISIHFTIIFLLVSFSRETVMNWLV